MKKAIGYLTLLILILISTACAGNSTLPASTSAGTAQEAAVTTSTDAGDSATPLAATPASSASAAEALAENSPTHDNPEDYVWDSSAATSITLNGDSIAVDGKGVTVQGTQAVILSAGTYLLQGTLNDGQILVDTGDEGLVRLVLNGVEIHHTTSAPLYVKKAEEALIVLAEGSENTLSDGSSYVFADAEEDEPNAALFSKANLTIYGDGSLVVNGNYNDGIASKDGLVIASGTITVNAADDGIRGKDYLLVKDGHLIVNAQGDGLKADNEEEADKGYIAIQAGSLEVVSGGDALSAQTDIAISGGTFTLTAGGGNQNFAEANPSAKGIKAIVNLNIDNGSFTIDSADDALHTNGNLTINAGDFSLASGDDGLHADTTLTINNGTFHITRSYEGIESAVITINGGDIHVVASDDGLNVAGGMDSSGMMGPGGAAGGMRGGGHQPGGAPGGMAAPGGAGTGNVPGQDAFNYTGSNYLYIHGGHIAVEAAGDGVDVNGAVEMTAGTLLVNGPTEQMNGALDYDGGFKMSGGFLVAAGSTGMAQAPDTTSSQNAVLVYFSSPLPAGTLVHIQDSTGKEVLTFAPTKSYQSIAFSSPALVQGETYTIYTSGSSSGTSADSLYEGGTYTPGTQYTSFTPASTVTLVGSGGGRNRP